MVKSFCPKLQACGKESDSCQATKVKLFLPDAVFRHCGSRKRSGLIATSRILVLRQRDTVPKLHMEENQLQPCKSCGPGSVACRSAKGSRISERDCQGISQLTRCKRNRPVGQEDYVACGVVEGEICCPRSERQIATAEYLFHQLQQATL